MYPLRFPLASLLGSMGVPLLIKVEIICDKEAQVYVATSPDVEGLVVEAESLDEVKREALELIPSLLSANKQDLYRKPYADFSFRQHLLA